MNLKLCFIAVVVLIASSCTDRGQVKKITPKVKCQRVQRMNEVCSETSYPGKVSPAVDINLSFRVAGVIDRLLVKEGDYIRKDQVVAYMDNRDYKLQLDATEAEYSAIKAEADRVIAMYKEESVSANDYDKAVNGLKQITSKLAAHRNAYEDTSLKAPFDGYVQRVNFNKGEAVSAGMPIISFISSSAPEIVVNIPAVEYNRRSELVSASATVANFPDIVFDLERISVAHKANLNQLYEAKFRVKSNAGKLPAIGVSAMVSLNYDSSSTDNYFIPISAVVEKSGSTYVWLIVDNKAHMQPIAISNIKGDGTVIVTNGLSLSDIVITAGTRTLTEGMCVEPLATPSKSNVGDIL